MKKILIPIIFLFHINGFADSTYFTPSAYYSLGDYTSGTASNSYAGYLSLGTYKQSFLFSYDHLRLKNQGWNYDQNYFNAGGVLGINQNIYLKFIYGHASGTYDSKTENYSYQDHIDLYSFDAFYTNYFFYAGAGYTFQTQGGYLNRDIHQIMGRLEHIPHWRVLLSLKPVFTSTSDDKNLFGLLFRAHYLPHDNFLIKLHGFAGERTHFFDPDLMILFNQDEVQKYLGAVQLEYFFTPHFNLAAGVQHTSFGSYKINYYILGVRTSILSQNE